MPAFLRTSVKALWRAPAGARGIAGKVLRETLNWAPRPKPFPWETQPYTLLHRLMRDVTSARFNANTKVVVVEGPVAAGKSALAAQLAQELDMRHFPEATLDLLYVDSYGFDLRSLDPEMPESCRTYDHKDFCRNPRHVNAANFQIVMYRTRCSQYLDALTHLLNTGQGVVLERCPYSDFVFADAMAQCGFISKPARNAYAAVKNNTIGEFRKPHLVIYLDVPVKVTQERVKARQLPHEAGSEVFSTEFLTTMERQYKQKYLKEIGQHAEVLVYDWTTPGDTEVLVEDIERIDFDNYWIYDTKMKDWNFYQEQELADLRMEYTNNKPQIMNMFNLPVFDVPELVVSADDCFARNKVLEKVPSLQFAPGFNKAKGDTGLLFKNKTPWREGFT